jgi:anti-sigma B factor antagonist
MNLQAEHVSDVLVIHVMEDRIDAAGAIQFKEKMRELVTGTTPVVILDLSQVAFLDSSGLGAVVSVLKLMGPDRKLQLSGLTPTVEKVFRLTRMDTIFTIHRTPPEQVRHVG